MKMSNISDVQDFLKTVDQCDGQVWMQSSYGDQYNMKSLLTQYLVIGELVKDHKNDLELFCELTSDECKFYDFFAKHPSVLEA